MLRPEWAPSDPSAPPAPLTSHPQAVYHILNFHFLTFSSDRQFCGSNTPPGAHACQYVALPSSATAVHRVAARNALLSM